MQFTVQLPDHIAHRLSEAGAGDLSRRALESIAADEYRNGYISKPELRQLLGMETGDQIDGFLKAHGVYEEYSIEDLNLELASLQRLGV